MVPLTEGLLVSDLIKQIGLPVILVSKNYLGSINHTLLSIEHLQRKEITIAGIIFNGDSNLDSESYILNYSGLKLLGKIPKADIISKGFIIQQADRIRENLLPLLTVDADTSSSSALPIDYESF
jgi:dethiobiotin synthetase